MEKSFVSAAPKETIEGPYLNGYRHGTWKSFDPYGEVVTQTEYAFGLDTACVYGERLSCVIYPNKQIVSVEANKRYSSL